ncbi:hypothetical protein AX17_001524 [Amanita inopinata Kibby_2008]|nr:hypothetical protein AX17_001524 [Amanita inopinata Kibby_2008]
MSTAAARAEARRKAILSRGSDRLAKLTTTARGEDATYLHDDSPAGLSTSLRSFVGEESPPATMPVPIGLGGVRGVSPSPGPPLTATSSKASDSTAFSSFEDTTLDPNIWSPEIQQRLMQAMMAGAQSPDALPGQLSARPRKVSQASDGRSSREGSVPPFDEMMASTLFPVDMKMGANATMQEEQKPKTMMQKLVPVIHMLAIWTLLVWFIVWRRGEYSYLNSGLESSLVGDTKTRFWERWANLSGKAPQLLGSVSESVGVSFFWAFATLQIVLHSIRLFSGFDALQPPTLLAVVLPHLPQQISTVVLNGLRYLQMGSMLLDDIAWLIVGLGFLVYVATWITS